MRGDAKEFRRAVLQTFNLAILTPLSSPMR
jgi:hypothetical protein